VDLKRVDGGRSNAWFDQAVAALVAHHRASGGTYNKSIGIVAEKANLTERRVQQIWSRYKDRWPFNPAAPQPDYLGHAYPLRSSEAR
jgi:hypothetical protein